MRLLTRQEIAEEFRVPANGVDTRMAELGVLPYPPPTEAAFLFLSHTSSQVGRAYRQRGEFL